MGLESGGLESGRLEVVVYLKSTSELNCVINKNQGTFDFINKSKVLLGLESVESGGQVSGGQESGGQESGGQESGGQHKFQICASGNGFWIWSATCV